VGFNEALCAHDWEGGTPLCCGSPHVDRFVLRFVFKSEARSWLMFLHRILPHGVVLYKYGFAIDRARATVANNL